MTEKEAMEVVPDCLRGIPYFQWLAKFASEEGHSKEWIEGVVENWLEPLPDNE